MSLLDRVKSYVYNRIGPDGTTIPSGQTTDPDDGLDSRMSRALRNADSNPIVFAVVNWLANQISTAPMFMEQVQEDGDSEMFVMHDLLRLLRNPNPYLSGRELLSVSSWDMLLKGQCFWLKERRRAGQVETLKYLLAGEVEVRGNTDELVTDYLWKPNGQSPQRLDLDEVVHIRVSPNPRDPKNGLPPLIALARSLLLDSQRGDYTSVFLSEVGSAGGFLMPPSDVGVISDDVAKETRKYIQQEFRGTKRGTLGVLRAAMNFVRTAVDPKSAGTFDVHDEVVELICAVFGVHPVIVGLGAGNAQSRVGAATVELERAAWANRVIPIQDTISEQIGRQLLPEFVPEAENWVLGWDRSNVYSLQPDMVREAQRWAINVNAGIATRYMALEGQNLPAEETDKVLVIRSNTLFVRPEDALAMQEQREQAAQEIAQAQAEAQSEEGDDEGDGDGEESEGEASRLSLVKNAILHMARSKVDLTPEQRRLFIAFARDQEILSELFGTDLEAAFEDLGARAEEAYWVVAGPEIIRATGIRYTNKQDPTDSQLADDIIRAMSITVWEQGVLIPAWDGHTLRTIDFTVGTINGSLGLGLNLPDPASRRILESGGTRRGLIDFTEQTRQSLLDALAEARELGGGPRDFARRIRSRVPAGPFPNAGSAYRAELIARTETAFAQNRTAIETYRAGEFAAVLITDGDYDPPCAALNGVRVTLEEFELIGELQHPNCTRSIAPLREL